MNVNSVKYGISQGHIKMLDNGCYLVLCSLCNSFRMLKTRESARRAYKDRHCVSCVRSIVNKKRMISDSCRESMSKSAANRYMNPEERKKSSEIAKVVMQRPDVRSRHVGALSKSRWIKVKTDVGQLELLEKWNKLGFNFEPNYQIHTDESLFYIDGYDPIHNVVMEYDGKYHMKNKQKKLDLDRQNKIINILNPRVFWRFNAVTNKFNDVYRSSCGDKQTVLAGTLGE